MGLVGLVGVVVWVGVVGAGVWVGVVGAVVWVGVVGAVESLEPMSLPVSEQRGRAAGSTVQRGLVEECRRPS